MTFGNFLSQIEIINPLDGLIGRLLHGPMHRFTWKIAPGYSGKDVEMRLRQYGIRVWGREMDDGPDRGLLVRQSQAVWAEYVLCRAGVPLTSPLLNSRHTNIHVEHGGTMPSPWTSKGVGARSLVDRLVDLI